MRGKYVEFALINPNLGGYGFSTYVDVDGNVQFITKYKNEFGQPIKKHYEFNQSRRIIRVPANQKEEIEFLRKAPECEGSPNGIYKETEGKTHQIRVYFREINEGKDASVAVSATKDRVKAQNKAFEISEDGEKLKQVAVLCGCFNEDPGIQLSHILQYSETSPLDFIEMVDGPEVEASYLVKTAIKKGVMTKVGTAIKYSDLAFDDEDHAISKVMSDKALKSSLKKAISKY